MINTVGKRRNSKKIATAASKVAQHLGINQPITLNFLKQTNEETLGFAAEITGSQWVCIFNNCPEDKLAEVISHELVHTWQMVRGDLIFDYNDMTFEWKGDTYDEARLASIDYYSRPWEAEARQMEQQLKQLFV